MINEKEFLEPPPWNHLPIIALTKIYDDLDFNDRIQASNTCKSWRQVIFQKRFLKSINLRIGNENDHVSQEFLDLLPAAVTDLTITFDYTNRYHAKIFQHILDILKISTSILYLTLRPKSYNELNMRCDENNFINTYFLSPLEAFLTDEDLTLKKFDAGCFEQITQYSEYLFLANKKLKQNIETLTLATIKQNPQFYEPFEYQYDFFTKFDSLQVLSIDYDNICDTHLKTIENLPIKKLFIHVHVWSSCRANEISDSAWESFSLKNPTAEVYLTLMYAFHPCWEHEKLFKSNMPLSHLKVLYCKHMNVDLFNLMAMYYEHTLKSIIWVDMLSNQKGSRKNGYDIFDTIKPNPLVILAWKCKKLYELVLHGYILDPANLICIARLRGNDLKRFEVSQKDLMPLSGYTATEINEHMSKALKRSWHPLYDNAIQHMNVNNKKSNKMFDVRKNYISKLIRADFDN